VSKNECRICHRCRNEVIKSDNPEYSYQCLKCDEDLYEFETKDVTNGILAAEQHRGDVVIGHVTIGFGNIQKAHTFTENVNAHRGRFIVGEFDGLDEELADALNRQLFIVGEFE
jgi:hypothetical protein